MSHNVEYRAYPENVNKNKVQDEWDAYVRIADRGEGASGLPGKIRWLSPVFDTQDEAEEYIRQNDRNNYDQLAVRFRVPGKRSSRTDALWAKFQTEKAKFREVNAKLHFIGAKAEFIGCKNCGSKISSRYLTSNCCPVCRADMRPETVLKRLKAMSEKIEKIWGEYQESQKKDNQKSDELNWLVKIEYHT